VPKTVSTTAPAKCRAHILLLLSRAALTCLVWYDACTRDVSWQSITTFAVHQSPGWHPFSHCSPKTTIIGTIISTTTTTTTTTTTAVTATCVGEWMVIICPRNSKESLQSSRTWKTERQSCCRSTSCVYLIPIIIW